MYLDLTGNEYVSKEERPKDQLFEIKKFVRRMLTANELKDVKVISEVAEIPAHKVVLSGRVRFFCDALHYGNAAKNTIEIPPEISPDIARLIVEYAYFIEPQVTLLNAQTLLEAAAFFRIEDLWASCDQFIAKRVALSVEDCLEVRSYATVRSAKMLARKADVFIAEYLDAVSDTDAFTSMSDKDISSVFSMNDLEVLPNEENFWEALLKWIKADTHNRKSMMPKLLRLLRLPCLSADVIIKKVLTHPYIHRDFGCLQMVTDVLLHKADPSNSEVRQRCEDVFDSMTQRCKKIDHIYYLDACKVDDENHGRIKILQNPEWEWSEMCWKAFPNGYNTQFKKVIVVKYIVYCVNDDNVLLSYNSVTKRWTVIQGDEGRPDFALCFVDMCCINGKLLVRSSRFNCDLQEMFWRYDPTINFWSQITLSWPEDREDVPFFTSCCHITSLDGSNEMLCVLCSIGVGFRVLLFDVPSGNLIKYGKSLLGYGGVNCTCDGLATYGTKVFIAVSTSSDGNVFEEQSYEELFVRVKVYDISSNEWSSLPDLDDVCLSLLVVANDRLYSFNRLRKDDTRCCVRYIDVTDGSSSYWQDCPKLSMEVNYYYEGFAVVCRYPF